MRQRENEKGKRQNRRLLLLLVYIVRCCAIRKNRHPLPVRLFERQEAANPVEMLRRTSRWPREPIGSNVKGGAWPDGKLGGSGGGLRRTFPRARRRQNELSCCFRCCCLAQSYSVSYKIRAFSVCFPRFIISIFHSSDVSNCAVPLAPAILVAFLFSLQNDTTLTLTLCSYTLMS